MGLLDNLRGPMAQLGLGLLDAGAPRMSYNPADLAPSGIGAGLLTGLQNYNQYEQQQSEQDQEAALNEIRRQELALKQAKALREAKAQRELEATIAQLPPDQRAWARLNPAAAVKAIAAQQGNTGGMFQGSGMEPQRYNTILKRGIDNFMAQNPDATEEQVKQRLQEMRFDLSKRKEMTSSITGYDKRTGQPIYSNPPPLPAWASAGQPSPQSPAPQPQGLLDGTPPVAPPAVSPAFPPTPEGGVVPGMTAPTTGDSPSGLLTSGVPPQGPLPNGVPVSRDDVLARTPAGGYVSPEDVKALQFPLGTLIPVNASPTGAKSFGTPISPPPPNNDIGKLLMYRGEVDQMPDGPEKTEALRLVKQKLMQTSMGAEALRALQKMETAEGTLDFFNQVADLAEGDTGNIAGRITEAKMDKDSFLGPFIRLFSDQTAAEGILYAMSSTMKTQLGTALSGAAIPKDEWPNYEAQIPQITDSKEARYAKTAAYKQFMRISRRVAGGELSEAAAREDMRKILLDVAKGGGRIGPPGRQPVGKMTPVPGG